MIDREDVDRAFDVCLRRPVGDESTYAFFCGLQSLDEVYTTLCESPEFRGRFIPTPEDMGTGPQPIEVATTPERLQQMIRHVEATWTQLGETDPHWSVITDPMFRAGVFDENRESYRDYGRFDELCMGNALSRAAIDTSRLRTCFELGCGTGRVTEFLAKRFPKVIAADISQAHLAAARTALADFSNVTLLHLARLDALASLPALRHAV